MGIFRSMNHLTVKTEKEHALLGPWGPLEKAYGLAGSLWPFVETALRSRSCLLKAFPPEVSLFHIMKYFLSTTLFPLIHKHAGMIPILKFTSLTSHPRRLPPQCSPYCYNKTTQKICLYSVSPILLPLVLAYSKRLLSPSFHRSRFWQGYYWLPH